MQAAFAAGATREDVVGVPHLVPRAALADEHLNRDGFAAPPSVPMSSNGRYCCKTLFGSRSTNFPDRWCGDQTFM